MAGLILHTTILIDLEREEVRGSPGPATRFLQGRPGERLHITPIAAGELAAGGSMTSRARWETAIAPFHMLPLDEGVCWEYGRAARYLRANGTSIGAQDLWIAAAGIAYGMPVVTRNQRDFTRVPGLDVIAYA